MQKRKMPILVSVIVIALVTVGLGMGTMAYYTDTETSEGNTLTAAIMDLKVDRNPNGAVFNWVDDPNLPVMQIAFGVLNLSHQQKKLGIIGILL